MWDGPSFIKFLYKNFYIKFIFNCIYIYICGCVCARVSADACAVQKRTSGPWSLSYRSLWGTWLSSGKSSKCSYLWSISRARVQVLSLLLTGSVTRKVNPCLVVSATKQKSQHLSSVLNVTRVMGGAFTVTPCSESLVRNVSPCPSCTLSPRL